MSYILDALKKAESERKMGGVPDLHTQPVSRLAQHEKSASWNRPLLVGAGLLLAVSAVLLTWFKPWHTTGGNPVPPARQAVIAPTPQIEAKSAVPQIATTAPAAIVPPSPPPPLAERQPTPSAAPAKRPVEQRTPVAQTPGTSETRSASKPEPLPPPKQAAAASADTRVPEFSELPEAIRREIPAFTFGGYLYSSSPTDRTVLVDNRLLHEGDQIAPGLTLERMMPKEAVLNYLGHRYRIAY